MLGNMLGGGGGDDDGGDAPAKPEPQIKAPPKPKKIVMKRRR